MKVEVYFESLPQIVERELRSANKEVLIAIAWINFNVYGELLLELLKKGVKINIVCNDSKSNKFPIRIIEMLKNNGLIIRYLSMPNDKNFMHHKFAIIDSNVIVNGSFNWSKNSVNSFENLTIIRGFLAEAQRFVQEHKKLQIIEVNTTESLQRRLACNQKACIGEVFNILVFGDKFDKYYEVTGDIISWCDHCDSRITIKEGVVNTTLPMLLNEYRGASDYDREKYFWSIDNELNEYINDEIIIHGIGLVHNGLDGEGEDFFETRIVWKNFFSGDRLPDVFGDAFDVYYGYSSEI